MNEDYFISAHYYDYFKATFPNKVLGTIIESKSEDIDNYYSGIVKLGKPKLANTFFI